MWTIGHGTKILSQRPEPERVVKVVATELLSSRLLEFVSYIVDAVAAGGINVRVDP